MNGLSLPRPEHPNPHFERTSWLNLNGKWSCSFDFGRSGVARKFAQHHGFDEEILVPFCPESVLSGIGYTDYIESFWYHRTVEIPQSWCGRNVLLHFGGVDYECDIYVNGRLVGSHYGGSSPFAFDITKFLRPDEISHLVVHVRDEIRAGHQAGGKQSIDYRSAGCFYGRTTGIWQTVWLEAVSPFGLRDCQLLSDIAAARLVAIPTFYQPNNEHQLTIRIVSGDQVVAEVVAAALNGVPVELHLDRPRLWSPTDPHLYEVVFELRDRGGVVVDRVSSYYGLRSISITGNQLHLNGEPLYLRFVLDQGFYPEGLWTAPTEDALRDDIILAQTLGFNGARLHQKVFEHRFHYWADRLGFLTWAESPSWGINLRSELAALKFLREWREIVHSLRNHPSIMAWTPLNETWDTSDRRVHTQLHEEAYTLTKLMDPTRPVNGASGGCQVVTDIYTAHVYEQDPELLHNVLSSNGEYPVFRTLGEREAEYGGQPYIVDEFGGIVWESKPQVSADTSRRKGEGPQATQQTLPRSLPEFYERLMGQVGAIQRVPHISGYCYTQLTDVEQERNGLVNYDRTPKFDHGRLRAIFGKVPSRYTEEPEESESYLSMTEDLLEDSI